MSRTKNFIKAVARPITVKDSRFGLRKRFMNDNELPSIFTYGSPGKGQNGEHQV